MCRGLGLKGPSTSAGPASGSPGRYLNVRPTCDGRVDESK
jgi:hypothetical protein